MRIQLTSVLPVLIAIVSISTCGKKEEEDSTILTLLPPDAFLTTELTKGSKVNALIKADAEEKIKNKSEFYDDGSSSLVQIKSEDCISRIMNSIPVKSYGSYIGMGAEADITKCAQELFPSNVTASPSTLRIAFQWGCDNQDFSSFDGKTYGEIAQAEDGVCNSSTKINTLLHVKMTLGAASGTSLNYEKQLFIGQATATGQACAQSVEAGDLKYADGCLFTNRDLQTIYKVNGSSNPKEGAEDFTQLETSNLISASGSGNVWYKSGIMKGIFNNWTGEVTYSNTTTAPSYSFSDGTETATGTLGSTKSLAGQRRMNSIAKVISARLAVAAKTAR